MTEPLDYSKVRVTFLETGDWIEAQFLEINFEQQDIGLRGIGEFHVTCEADKKTLMDTDAIAFGPEVEPIKIVCDAGEIVLPFGLKEEELNP